MHSNLLPGKDGVLLTSNRDEKQYRSLALVPHTYSNHLGKVMYPLDPDGGGTWIAVHENRNAIVFLNGGFESHQPNPPYRRSRGLILLDLLACERPSVAFKDLSLVDVEPFTAVIWDANELLTCVWDGNDKHRVAMDSLKPHIWSSSTLYTHQVRENAHRGLPNGFPKAQHTKWKGSWPFIGLVVKVMPIMTCL